MHKEKVPLILANSLHTTHCLQWNRRQRNRWVCWTVRSGLFHTVGHDVWDVIPGVSVQSLLQSFLVKEVAWKHRQFSITPFTIFSWVPMSDKASMCVCACVCECMCVCVFLCLNVCAWDVCSQACMHAHVLWNNSTARTYTHLQKIFMEAHGLCMFFPPENITRSSYINELLTKRHSMQRESHGVFSQWRCAG